MFAAQRGDAHMVRRLIESGADPNVRGTHVLTALGFAQQNGHNEVARIIVQSGAHVTRLRCQDPSQGP